MNVLIRKSWWSLSIFISVAALAQEEGLERVTVYGRLATVPMNELHASVHVMTKDDIEKLNAVSALDIIKFFSALL